MPDGRHDRGWFAAQAVLAPERFLGFALAFSSATQLRTGPIGPAEALLSLWIGLGALSLIWARRIRLGPAFGTFGTFWGLSLIALLGGLLMASYTGHMAADPLRDLLAYFFSMALVFVYCARTDFSSALTTARWFCAFSTLMLGAVLAAALMNVAIPMIEPWDAFRLKGWANNPNQLAFHSGISTAFLLGLWGFTGSPRGKVVIVLGIMVNIAVGVFTFSDALFVSWACGAMVLITTRWHFYLVDSSASRFAQKMAMATVTFGFAFALVFFYRFINEAVGELASSIYGNANQGDIRLALWRHGVEAISSSPVFGLGPGAHSGDTSPFQGKEAHNSFIDWGMSTGLVGVTLFLGLWAKVIRSAFRARATTILGALAIQAAFCQFHHALRHPVFWLTMVFMFLASRSILHRSSEATGPPPVAGSPG